jgi:hypothetical protein
VRYWFSTKAITSVESETTALDEDHSLSAERRRTLGHGALQARVATRSRTL